MSDPCSDCAFKGDCKQLIDPKLYEDVFKLWDETFKRTSNNNEPIIAWERFKNKYDILPFKLKEEIITEFNKSNETTCLLVEKEDLIELKRLNVEKDAEGIWINNRYEIAKILKKWEQRKEVEREGT